MKMETLKKWLLFVILSVCMTTSFASCSSDDDDITDEIVSAIADQVWEYAQSHPDGFTLELSTFKAPKVGVAVSYAATQDSHSRDQLDFVVRHALEHDGYVGGCYNNENGLYYFDSTRLFPEDELEDAIQFGKENGQHSVFILSSSTDVPI